MATVATPVKGFNGIVAGVSFADGVGETDDPGALAYFRRHGYQVGAGQDDSAGFDPGEHTVDEVLDYLAGLDNTDPDVHDAEVARVVEAERSGKARKTLLEAIEGTPSE